MLLTPQGVPRSFHVFAAGLDVTVFPHLGEGWVLGFQPGAACVCSLRMCAGVIVIRCIRFMVRGHRCEQVLPVLTAIAALPGFCPSLPWLLPWENTDHGGGFGSRSPRVWQLLPFKGQV